MRRASVGHSRKRNLDVEAQWRGENREEIAAAEAGDHVFEDGIALKLVYGPRDAGANGSADASFPGQFPYTRGIDAAGYRKELWRMSQYAGWGTARETNVLFRSMAERGSGTPYLALDLPTQLGLDPDHPMAMSEVGVSGTSVASLKDWETIFDGINLEKTFVSTVINAPAPIFLAMHIVLAEKQGADLRKIRGSLQNDILKEFTARGNFIYPVEPSLRMVTDTLEYCAQYLPAYWPLNVSGAHYLEAGANRLHETAFALAAAFAYIDEAVARGVPIDSFAPNMFFLMKICHTDLLEEVAKYRALRRIWARTLREKYGARNPESLRAKVRAHSSGSLMTRERPELNIARTTLACVAGVLSGVQMIGLNTMDEVFGIPTEKSLSICIGTQQVVARETGLTEVVDPLGGSYFIESLTATFEKAVMEELDRINAMGGMLKAISSGYIRKAIADDAYTTFKSYEDGSRIKVGVNEYVIEDTDPPRRPYVVSPDEQQRQIDAVKQLRRERDNDAVQRALAKVREDARRPAETASNMMPSIIEAVRAYATVGEISDVLRDVFGEYREPTNF